METINLDEVIPEIIESGDTNAADAIIKDYIPFVLKTVSGVKNRFITHEDEEFSVGLLGFHEAMKRYNKSKGHFLPYAKIVITSRLNNYWNKEKRHIHDSINDIEESYQTIDTGFSEDDVSDEIIILEKALNDFNIKFEMLVENSPKHKDTRERALNIAIKTTLENDLMDFIMMKKRLPVSKMCDRFFVSPKIIKRSRLFIVAVILIKINNLVCLEDWIKLKG